MHQPERRLVVDERLQQILSTRLRKAREAAGLSGKAAAEHIGVEPTVLNGWEINNKKGKKQVPQPAAMIVALMLLYGVTVEEVAGVQVGPNRIDVVTEFVQIARKMLLRVSSSARAARKPQRRPKKRPPEQEGEAGAEGSA